MKIAAITGSAAPISQHFRRAPYNLVVTVEAGSPESPAARDAWSGPACERVLPRGAARPAPWDGRGLWWIWSSGCIGRQAG